MSKTNSLYISKHSDKICILGKSFGLPDDSDENDKIIVDSINKELIDLLVFLQKEYKNDGLLYKQQTNYIVIRCWVGMYDKIRPDDFFSSFSDYK